MTCRSIRERIEQHRPLLLRQDFFLPTDCVDHGQRIIAVDAFRMHLLRIDAGAESGEDFKAHRFAVRLSAHCVLVVVEVKDQRKAAVHIALPELFVLVHCRKADRFPDRTAAE